MEAGRGRRPPHSLTEDMPIYVPEFSSTAALKGRSLVLKARHVMPSIEDSRPTDSISQTLRPDKVLAPAFYVDFM